MDKGRGGWYSQALVTRMIELTRFNKGDSVVVNTDLIEIIEPKVDNTVITLTTGRQILVQESVRDIMNQVAEFKRHIFSGITVKKFHVEDDQV